jgi:ATPase family AAA domain-containing protein 3A/B
MKKQLFLMKLGMIFFLFLSFCQLNGADDPFSNLVNQVSGHANAAMQSATQAAQLAGQAQQSALQANQAREQVAWLSEFMQGNYVNQQEQLQNRERQFYNERQVALIAAEDARQVKKLADQKLRQDEHIAAQAQRQQEEIAAQILRQQAEHQHQNQWWENFYAHSGAALKATGDFVSEPKKMGGVALGVTAIALGIYSARHGTSLAKILLQKYLTTPSLVKDTNVPTFLKKVLAVVAGEEELAEVDFDQLILTPDIKDRVMNVAKSAQKITHNKDLFENANYQNVCFYGPPGTGKTMAAKMLAGYADMHYAYINGGDVAKLSKADAILQLQALFKWAETSNKGLLLFVDEAESFLCNREGASEDLKQMVNAFIAECGTSSKKFMIATATNHVTSLDTAVRSRIEHFIPFEYPGPTERHAIIDLYLKKFSKGKKGREVVVIESGINYESIVQKTKDFSGRDLEKMINDLVLQAQMNHDGIISNTLFQKVASIWKEQIPIKRKMGIDGAKAAPAA